MNSELFLDLAIGCLICHFASVPHESGIRICFLQNRKGRLYYIKTTRRKYAGTFWDGRIFFTRRLTMAGVRRGRNICTCSGLPHTAVKKRHTRNGYARRRILIQKKMKASAAFLSGGYFRRISRITPEKCMIFVNCSRIGYARTSEFSKSHALYQSKLTM